MADVLPSLVDAQPVASTSASARPLCAVCDHRYSVYTCPRCSTRTCSFPCSATHKSLTSCSGLRDKAKYVPMNEYGWGTMMDDYVLLEEMSRRVGDWGKEIVRGGFAMRRSSGDTGRRGGGGRGRSRGGSNWTGGDGKTKRDYLKIQLDLRDIDMDLLPVGMERRSLNQSVWDYKNSRALLTVEFKFHCPPGLSSSSCPQDYFTILTHQNDLETPLISLVQAHVNGRNKPKKGPECPDWVKALVCPDTVEPESFVLPHCVMVAKVNTLSISGRPPKAGYYTFDLTERLSILLRNTHFVEFPTLEIWEQFQGTIVDAEGTVTQEAEEVRLPKRRKFNPKAGKKAIRNLLGDYGSESEGEQEEQNVLSILGGYAGSDDEDAQEKSDLELRDNDAETDEEEMTLDPAKLLELMRKVEGNEGLAEGREDDVVDWGESGEEDESE